jgi:hypothetical protein
MQLFRELYIRSLFRQGQPRVRGHSPDKVRQRQGSPPEKGSPPLYTELGKPSIMEDCNLNSRALQQWERRGFICLTLPYCSSSKEVRIETQAG